MATSAAVPSIPPGGESPPEGPDPAFVAQLRRILDSSEFSSSKRLSEFFAFIGEASLAGRQELDQYEIAERFLHRGGDFNPLDDATVRKLASQTRRKLESYYGQPDRRDPVIIFLPLRSYLPRFRYHEIPAAASGPWSPPATNDERSQTAGESEASVDEVLLDPARPVEKPPKIERRAPWRAWPPSWGAKSGLTILGVIAVVALASLVPARRDESKSREPSGAFDVVTATGDIMHAGANLGSRGILLGPAVGPGEDVIARMEFTPERATQQAGVLLFHDPDEYVKLGRQFNDRARLEFGYETNGHYRKTPDTFAFDPSGQTGAPIWLNIRRSENEYLAYVSSDGTSWTPFGERLARPSGPSRLAIFGFNGRTNAPPAAARFSQVGVGLWFHDRGDPDESLAAAKDWDSTASAEGIHRYDDRGAMLVRVSADRPASWRLMTHVPKGDWTLETKLDFVSIGGTFAGLHLVGSRGDLRLIRWDLNGGSITLEHMVNTQVSVPDFPGNPPVILRLTAIDGVVRGYLSRDGTRFIQIDEEVRLAALGSDLKFGIATGASSWSDSPSQAEPRFYYVLKMVTALEPFTAGL